MVKPSGKIEQELGLLQQQTEDMAEALEPLYEGYLKALGEASQRQLVVAVHHLCTQAYPEKFLALSWQQRNQLQKSMQKLAAEIHAQLVMQREQAKKISRRPQQHKGLAFLQRLLEARAAGATMIATDGSSDDLAEKLAALKLSELRAAQSSADSSQSAERSEAEEDGADLFDRSPTDRSTDLGAASFDDSQKNRRRYSDDKLPEALFEDKGIGHENLEHNDLEHDGPDRDRPDSHPSENSDASGDSFGSDSFEEAVLDSDEVEDDGLDNATFEAIEFSEPDDGLGSRAADDDLDFEMDVPAAEQRLTLSEEEDLLAAIEGLARQSVSDRQAEASGEQPLAPMHLVKQQVLLERAIRDVFKTVSEEINALLQKSHVKPNFPKALMAAATDSRSLNDSANSVPNVVKVSIRVMHGEAMLEEEGTREPKEHPRRSRKAKKRSRHSQRFLEKETSEFAEEKASSMRQFVPREAVEIEALPEFAAIALQLSEVEFADPTVSAWRRRLRQQLSELKQLGSRYQKAQRALETAQAEDAWRASWTGLEEE